MDPEAVASVIRSDRRQLSAVREIVDSKIERILEINNLRLVHRLISGRHTAVGDLADFQGASDEHTEIRT